MQSQPLFYAEKPEKSLFLAFESYTMVCNSNPLSVQQLERTSMLAFKIQFNLKGLKVGGEGHFDPPGLFWITQKQVEIFE